MHRIRMLRDGNCAVKKTALFKTIGRDIDLLGMQDWKL